MPTLAKTTPDDGDDRVCGLDGGSLEFHMRAHADTLRKAAVRRLRSGDRRPIQLTARDVLELSHMLQYGADASEGVAG